MAEEAGRKSLIIFEDDRVFEGVDVPPIHDSKTYQKKYWLNFFLMTSVLMMLIISVNQLPASQKESHKVSIDKQFRTEELKLPVEQMNAIQEVIADQTLIEKNVAPELEKVVVKEPVSEQKKLVSGLSTTINLENIQTQLKSSVPKVSQTPVVVKSSSKSDREVDQVLDLTETGVVFNKKILGESAQNTSLQNSVNIQFKHAQVLLTEGDNVSAIRELKQVLTLDENHINARLLLTSKLIEKGQTEEAFKHYQKGIQLAPGESRLAKPLAHLLVDRGQVDQSLKILQKAAPSVNSDPDYYSFIAALQQQTGKHKNAITNYQQILKNQPDNGKWWLGLGISLMAEARNKEALLAFESSLRDKRVSSALKQFASQRIIDLKGSRSVSRGKS